MAKDAEYFFSIDKIKNLNKLRSALLHNSRKIKSNTNIDKNRSHLNYEIGLDKSSDAILDWIKKTKRQYSIRFRKNQILAIEILVSLPKMKMKNGFDEVAYFQACKSFIREEFECPFLSSTVHKDESHPHAHFIIFPLKDGKMAGAKVAGGPTDFRKRRVRFEEMVLSRFFYLNTKNKNSLQISSEKLLSKILNEDVEINDLMPLVTYFVKKDPTFCASLLPSKLLD